MLAFFIWLGIGFRNMTTTEEGGSYYYIWKYTYDNGLRLKEKCFSKEKRLMGTIEYEYK